MMSRPASAFQLSTMSGENEDFYTKLTNLKQENISHLQRLESELYGEKYKRSGSVKSQYEDRRPLFVLDMPCYCSNENIQDNESIEEQIEALFNGVSDEDDEESCDDLELVTRSSTKRSIRVQSAPIIIDEKRPHSAFNFKPTVVKPFKMTLR